MLTKLQEMLTGAYDVQRELGGGGMSRVFLARDLKLGRWVVIKLLPSELTVGLTVDRFRREIQIAATLRHPHIVPLLDAGEIDGTAYYTMPFIEGESLRARLQRDHVIPLREAIRLGGEVAEALSYAHQQGVIHRDIKPGNILLDSGHAVVTDFGIARALSESSLTVTGAGHIGTLAYMSPEQASGHALDGRSDIYSLACVLYEMVTGLSPTAAGQKVTDAATHAGEFGGLLPALSKALAANPQHRFDTAAQFRDALAREASAPRRRTIASLASFAVAAVGGGALVWANLQRPEPMATWTSRQISAVGAARSPALSPDGQRVAYIASDTLYVTDVRTGATSRLAAGQSLRRPAWTSGGNEVAFQSLDTIYAVPRSGGAARVLLAPANGNYAISADGKRIAWATATQGRSTFAIGSLGLSGTGGTLDTVARRELRPSVLSWSTDGRWLAVDAQDGVTIFSSDGRRESIVPLGSSTVDHLLLRRFQARGVLFWMSWSGGSDTLYVDGPGVKPGTVAAVIRSPDGEWRSSVPVDPPSNFGGTDFSTDGERFASIVAQSRFRLVRYTVDERGATRGLPVASGDASDRFYDLSPDGKTAAFARELDSLTDVYVVSADSRIPRRVTSLNAKFVNGVKWSPDGASIAFIYATDTSAGVGVVRPVTGELRLIRSDLPVTREMPFRRGRIGLGWTADGSRILFSATRSIQGVRVPGGVGTIELRSGRDSLIDSRVTTTPLVSPSGNEIGFSWGKGIVRFDWRTGHRDSTPVAFDDTPVRWERDGSMLVMRNDSSSTEIARISPVAGSRTVIAVVPSRCVDVSLAIDGRTVVCEEVETATEVWLATHGESRSRRW